jgi:hypothetical protein
VNSARLWFNTTAAATFGPPRSDQLIVFDIDETLLCNIKVLSCLSWCGCPFTSVLPSAPSSTAHVSLNPFEVCDAAMSSDGVRSAAVEVCLCCISWCNVCVCCISWCNPAAVCVMQNASLDWRQLQEGPAWLDSLR